MLWRYDTNSPQLFTVPGIFTVNVLNLCFASEASSKARSIWLTTALWVLPKFHQARVLCHTSVPWHIPQTGKHRGIPVKWRPYSVFFLLTRVVETECYQRADCMWFSGQMMHTFLRNHFGIFCERPCTTSPGESNVTTWLWINIATKYAIQI